MATLVLFLWRRRSLFLSRHVAVLFRRKNTILTDQIASISNALDEVLVCFPILEPPLAFQRYLPHHLEHAIFWHMQLHLPHPGHVPQKPMTSYVIDNDVIQLPPTSPNA